MIRFALIFALLLVLNDAHAKCTYVEYDITGVVTADGQAIANAEVAFKFARAYGVTGDVVRTNADGRYTARLLYAPDDDMHSVEEPDQPLCIERPAEVSIYIAADGFEPLTSNLALNNTRATANYSLKRTAAEWLR